MGWTNQVVRASEVIIAGAPDALLVYSPAPAAGTLIASISATTGPDPYGNNLVPTVATYGGGGSQVVALRGGVVSFDAANDTQMYLNGTNLVIYSIVGSLDLQLPAQPIYGLLPGTVNSNDLGTRLTLANGWLAGSAGNAIPSYQLVASPPGWIEVWGKINGGSATSAVFGQLPVNYRPAESVYVPAFCTSLTAPQTGVVIDTSGNMTLEASPFTNQYFFAGQFPVYQP